jgi:hypothetical protein
MKLYEPINLKWHGIIPPDIKKIELTVKFDIWHYVDTDFPSDLIFHTVFLDNKNDGESVHVWGEKGDDEAFHCQWAEHIEWVNLNGEKLK